MALRSVYRLQLHREFTFRDAAAIVPYLAELRVGTVYCSPYLKARPGSVHGYDICDHSQLNPELGGEVDYELFCEQLKLFGITQLIDVVPNHMAADPDANLWWRDVLERGASSEYARYFDIDWSPLKRELRGKLLLPVLGDHYGKVLEAGELRLVAASNGFAIKYGSMSFPIDMRTVEEGVSSAEIERLNGKPGDAESFDALHDLLERQHYRLACWRTASHEINYRRFFDVNELAGLRVEDPEVFEAAHRKVFELISRGDIEAIRLDHVDGLFNPKVYFERLQSKYRETSSAERGTQPLTIYVEKILGANESLSREWPIAGTTGYEFLNEVNGLFVDGEGLGDLDRHYRAFVADATAPLDTALYECKKLIMATSLAAELNVLADALNRISERTRSSRDFTLDALRTALAEFIACLPCYRTYLGNGEVSAWDRSAIHTALRAAARRNPAMERSIFVFLNSILLSAEHPPELDEKTRFVMKLQQYTGPVHAKGVEDTLFYRQNSLISLNDVGADAKHRALTPGEFHRQCIIRRDEWPNTLITTATHDTKRGEDVRMRINVLSEFASEWSAALKEWQEINRPFIVESDGEELPSRNDQYLFYQTVVGVWPVNGKLEEANLSERLSLYMRKATKEAKIHTSWISPNEEYDEAVQRFIAGALAQTQFIEGVSRFAATIARAGFINSLAQLLLKLTTPGVPDIYQGNELWDFSLVDPDNRRPVDYEQRREALESLHSIESPGSLLGRCEDGRIKLFLLQSGLQLRNGMPELFADGRYWPIEASGERAKNLVAFIRAERNDAVLVVVPRLVGRELSEKNPFPLGKEFWGDSAIGLPAMLMGRRAVDILSGRKLAVDGGHLSIGEILQELPVGLIHLV